MFDVSRDANPGKLTRRVAVGAASWFSLQLRRENVPVRFGAESRRRLTLNPICVCGRRLLDWTSELKRRWRKMAPVSDVEVEVSNRRGGALSLEDCSCPVCLEIFMEPVTLPCTHTFCKDCFLESVDKSTLCCPLCRKRVSTWARLNSRNNTLVNQQLWTHIQTSFPLQCQRRLSGQDAATEDMCLSVFFPRVSEPGELRQEYEEEVIKLTEEKRVFDEEERKASEEYIQRLLAEEEKVLQEERRRREEDERLARLLSNQLNSQENPRPVEVTPAKKKKKEAGGGQIERFLSPRQPASVSSDSNKENILVSLQEERLPPQLDYYGEISEDSDLCPSPLSDSVEDQPRRDGRPSTAKRKSSELEVTEDGEVTVTKRRCHSPHSSSSSPQEAGGLALQGIAELETELLSRRQQEEEDRRLALLLQKELDQEGKQRMTDRRKGTSDAYLLRQNRREKVEAGSSDPPGRASRNAPKASTSTSPSSSAASLKTQRASISSSAASVKTPRASTSSSAASSRGIKQATLTEIFSALSS